MRAADKIIAAQRVLRTEGTRVHFVQHVAAAVAIAVACRCHKVALADTCLHERSLHLLLIIPLCFGNFCKVRRSLLLRFLRRLQHAVIHFKKLVHSKPAFANAKAFLYLNYFNCIIFPAPMCRTVYSPKRHKTPRFCFLRAGYTLCRSAAFAPFFGQPPCQAPCGEISAAPPQQK